MHVKHRPKGGRRVERDPQPETAKWRCSRCGHTELEPIRPDRSRRRG
jgi:hypothetical protein